MNQAPIYARFSPRPMDCPKCLKRMNKLRGLDAYECPDCGHMAELGEGEQGSIQVQLQRCREHCERRGYAVSDEYYDEALSGAGLDRPGLDAAIDALKRGDVLVVYMLDRLSRGDAEQWFNIEKRIHDKKARYESVCGEGTWGGNNNEEDNELIRGILKLLACHQRKKGNRRTSESMQAYQQSGRRMTPLSKMPFGKMADPGDPKRMIDDPEEQETIKTILATHGAVLLGGKYRGLGYRETARRLGEMNITSRNGGAISHVMVTDVIKKHAAS